FAVAPGAGYCRKNIRFAVGIEIAEAKLTSSETRSVDWAEISRAAVREIPRAPAHHGRWPTRIKDIVAQISERMAQEFANGHIGDRARRRGIWARVGVENFPIGNASPGNDQLAAMHRDNIGAAITVKIAQQHLI